MPDAPLTPNRPSRRARLAVALAIGVAAAALHAWYATKTGQPDDQRPVWFAARTLLAGGAPYAAVGPGRALEFPWPLVYPLPAVLLFLPLASLSHVGAATAFVGIAFAVFAYAVTDAVGWVGLIACASGAAVMAVELAQWSPLTAAAAALPLLAPVIAAKPTVGLAMLAYRLDWRAAALAAGAVIAGAALAPAWLPTWWANTHTLTHLRAPITILPFGPLVLLALLRWRRPEARLLLALACVPQTALVYETLPIVALVPRRPVEALALAILTWVVMGYGPQFSGVPLWHPQFLPDFVAWARAVGPWLVAAVYLPALAMVLRRPNEGEAPAWLARGVARLRARAALPAAIHGDSARPPGPT